MSNLALATPRMLSGPESVRAARVLAERAKNQESWPYPWVFPPAAAKRRNPSASLAIPDVSANYSVILAFLVPTGFDFLLEKILLTAQVTGYIPGSGDLLWRVDVDNSPSATQLTAAPLPDLAGLTFPLGSLAPFSMFELSKAELVSSGQTLRARVRTVGGNTGAPQYTSAMFSGWLVPSVK